MKKSIFLIMLSAVLLLTACDISKFNILSGTNQLVLIYMVGSDLETEAGMATRDIEEIMSSNFNEENMTVLLCAGGANYWWTDEIRGENCAVYDIKNNSITKIYQMQNNNMANSQALTEFIDFAYKNYKSKQYNIVFWNHGGGAILGFGADETYDYDALSLQELDNALKETALFNDGQKFELLSFDACLMSSLEVANTMSPYANYMVASEETESGDGFNYAFLKNLSENPNANGQESTVYIINSYREYYEQNYPYAPDYAIAGLDLSCTNEVVSKLNELSDVAFNEIKNGEYSKIAKVRSRTKSFGKLNATSFYDTVDLYDLSEKLSTYYPKSTTELKSSLDKMVIMLDTNIYGANGVSIYFPYDNKDYLKEWLTQYSLSNFSKNYTSFITSFSSILLGTPLLQWETSLKAPIKDESSPDEYYLQLTDEQFANFNYAKYSIWQEEDQDSYICWINSSDVTVSNDGKISSAFSGKRFFLSDDSNNTLSCCAFEIDRNDDYIKYAIPILIIPKNSEGITLISAYIHFKISTNSQNCEIVGIYKTMETDKNLFPNRDIVRIEDGDQVYPFYFASKIAFSEDGNIAPFDEWESTSGIGDSFVVKGDINVGFKNPDENDKYLCLFDIYDTQGNSYFTKPIYIEY